MNNQVTIVVAQIDLLVGDIEGNARRIVECSQNARERMGANAIVFPELSLTGYPPEDLLQRPGMHRRVRNALAQICEQVRGIDMVVGYPHLERETLYNAAGVIREGEVVAVYHKQRLPNYSVFDEKRHFEVGTDLVWLTSPGYGWDSRFVKTSGLRNRPGRRRRRGLISFSI